MSSTATPVLCPCSPPLPFPNPSLVSKKFLQGSPPPSRGIDCLPHSPCLAHAIPWVRSLCKDHRNWPLPSPRSIAHICVLSIQKRLLEASVTRKCPFQAFPSLGPRFDMTAPPASERQAQAVIGRLLDAATRAGALQCRTLSGVVVDAADDVATQSELACATPVKSRILDGGGKRVTGVRCVAHPRRQLLVITQNIGVA